MTPSEKRLRFISEFLISLNVGFGIAYALFAYITDWYVPSYAPIGVQHLLERFSRFFLSIAPLVVSSNAAVHRRSLITWELGFVVVMVVTGLFIFGVWRLLEKKFDGYAPLGPFAGFAALVAVPSCWFYMIEITRPEPVLQQTFWSIYGPMFALEIIAAIVVVHFLNKGSFWWGNIIFVAHYLIWIWIMGRISGAPSITAVVLSPVFPISGIVWFRSAGFRSPSEVSV